jgi:hypothetical protein
LTLSSSSFITRSLWGYHDDASFRQTPLMTNRSPIFGRNSACSLNFDPTLLSLNRDQ